MEWAELDMQQLVLANNIISGTLPAAYGAAGNWPKLRLLDLSYNYFRGEQPSLAFILPSADVVDQVGGMLTQFN